MPSRRPVVWLLVASITSAGTALAQDAPPDLPPPEALPDVPPEDVPLDPPPIEMSATPPLDPNAIDPDSGSAVDAGDATFGPRVQIEAIEIVGNRTTRASVILRALPIASGDVLRTGDPRLSRARWKLLGLGYFRDVELALRKGSVRGRVVLTVTVAERGTIALNRLWFGTSVLSPYWLGFDLSDRNFLGTGLTVGGAVAYAGSGPIVGAREQWGGELRVAAPSIGGGRSGAYASFTGQHGSEAYRVSGPLGSNDADDLRAFAYRRLGGRVGLSYDLSTFREVAADLRVERIDARMPDAPTRTLPGGEVVPLDLGVDDGASRVVSLSLSYDRDTRPDPALPQRGARLQVQAVIASELLQSDYDYAALLARYERWWPLRTGHAIGLRLAGGMILGSAPRFDRIHIGDVNRLSSPRVLGMTTAITAPPAFLGTDNVDAVYGELGGNALVEYSYRWWRSPRRIYGADAFVAAGCWGLTTREALAAPDQTPWGAVPLDVVIDAGVRIDTEIGVFEFTFANVVGRVPRW